MGDVKEAVKSLAGAALGAAAAGAAGVVAETMRKQMSEGDKKGGDTGPGMMEKVAARSVAKPTRTSSKKRPASKKKEKGGEKEEGYCRAGRQKEKRSVKRRKKR